MRFSESFLEEIKARLPVSSVVGRHVALKRAGGEHKGLCPFHSEKTPSFTVVDDKDFYHCFGCGAHGSIFNFVMEHERCTFPEAVERLAALAGLPLPQSTPEEEEKYRKQLGLYEVLDKTSQFYCKNLKDPSGSKAVTYLKSRGITGLTARDFGIGYAPASRIATKSHLLNEGATESQIVAAGICIAPENGGDPYDRFRDRIMFPIQSLNGKIIGFGGRILDKNSREAKYINSPETDVFDKGRILYNLRQARQYSKAKQLIVVEGYMDVIALHQAGIRNAVAPLGTALTPDQIDLMWQYVDQIILCFDGDEAGNRASERSIERLLPLLKPGKEVRFVTLPHGMDPDDVIRARGAEAFVSLVEKAQPLADKLFALEREAKPLDTPEARSDFYRRLEARAHEIRDAGLQKSYAQHYRKLARSLFTTGRAPRKYEGAGILIRPRDMELNTEALCLALIRFPELAEEVLETFAGLSMPTQKLENTKKKIIARALGEEVEVHLTPTPGIFALFPILRQLPEQGELLGWWSALAQAVKVKQSAPKRIAEIV